MEYIKAPFNRIHTGTGTTLYLLQYDRQYDHVRKFKYYTIILQGCTLY